MCNCYELIKFITETAMGVQLAKENVDAGRTYKQSIYDLGNVLTKRFANFYYSIDFIYNLTSLKRNENKYVSTIHKFTGTIIEKRKTLIKNKDVEDINEEKECSSYKKRSAMLDLLVAAEKDGLIDKNGIQEEVDTFMFEVRSIFFH